MPVVSLLKAPRETQGLEDRLHDTVEGLLKSERWFGHWQPESLDDLTEIVIRTARYMKTVGRKDTLMALREVCTPQEHNSFLPGDGKKIVAFINAYGRA